MTEPKHLTAMTGEAEIKEMFRITGRGWVLVLKDDFRGMIHRNGIVQSDSGIATYIGPEIVDAISEKKAWLAVIVRDDAKPLFSPGQSVKFYTPPG